MAQAIGVHQQPLPAGLGLAVSRDGRAARYLLLLGDDPLGARALSQVRALQRRLDAHGVLGGDSMLSAYSEPSEEF